MNLLTLKVLVWNNSKQAFFSPSRNDFWWDITQKLEISYATNEHCNCSDDVIREMKIGDCTHGIYSSPNPEALAEYAKEPFSAIFVMENFGECQRWSSPDDICNGNGFIINAFGAQPIAVVNANPLLFDHAPEASTKTAIGIAQMRGNLKLLPYIVALKWIKRSWMDLGRESPYKETQYDI